MCNEECVPAVYTRCVRNKGQYASRNLGRIRAREELIKRDGPPPFPDSVCRHLCENDSTAPNGFVCTLHTVWGTQKENCSDKSYEKRRARSMETAVRSGKTSTALERTCEHCGLTMKGPVYFRYHGDNCKLASPPRIAVTE